MYLELNSISSMWFAWHGDITIEIIDKVTSISTTNQHVWSRFNQMK